MEWVNDPRLWIAATPLCVFIGAAIAFVIATEAPDDGPSERLLRGEVENEPWGRPYTIKKYRLPGDSVLRTRRVFSPEDTAPFPRIEDERNN